MRIAPASERDPRTTVSGAGQDWTHALLSLPQGCSEERTDAAASLPCWVAAGEQACGPGTRRVPFGDEGGPGGRGARGRGCGSGCLDVCAGKRRGGVSTSPVGSRRHKVRSRSARGWRGFRTRVVGLRTRRAGRAMECSRPTTAAAAGSRSAAHDRHPASAVAPHGERGHRAGCGAATSARTVQDDAARSRP